MSHLVPSGAPPVRWWRLVFRTAVQVGMVAVVMTSVQLAFGHAAIDAIEVGLFHGAVLSILPVWSELRRRRARHRGADPTLTLDQRKAASAASDRGPVPTDAAVRAEALRLARASAGENGDMPATGVVIAIVAAVGGLLAGAFFSHWWWCTGAFVVAVGLLVFISQRRLRRRVLVLEGHLPADRR